MRQGRTRLPFQGLRSGYDDAAMAGATADYGCFPPVDDASIGTGGDNRTAGGHVADCRNPHPVAAGPCQYRSDCVQAMNRAVMHVSQSCHGFHWLSLLLVDDLPFAIGILPIDQHWTTGFADLGVMEDDRWRDKGRKTAIAHDH